MKAPLTPEQHQEVERIREMQTLRIELGNHSTAAEDCHKLLAVIDSLPKQYTEEELRAEFEKEFEDHFGWSDGQFNRIGGSGLYVNAPVNFGWVGAKLCARFLGALKE